MKKDQKLVQGVATTEALVRALKAKGLSGQNMLQKVYVNASGEKEALIVRPYEGRVTRIIGEIMSPKRTIVLLRDAAPDTIYQIVDAILSLLNEG